MPNATSLKNFYWLGLSVGVLLLDLWSKGLALAHLQPLTAVKLTGFFNLTLAFNYGAAFSFLHNAGGWQNAFFILIAVIISIYLLNLLYQLTPADKGQGVAIACILGGAWGNVIDRLRFGYVVDFLDFHLADHHWPIFNIADSAICVGAVLMLILLLKQSNKNESGTTDKG